MDSVEISGDSEDFFDYVASGEAEQEYLLKEAEIRERNLTPSVPPQSPPLEPRGLRDIDAELTGSEYDQGDFC
jgi:hypothetical protein